MQSIRFYALAFAVILIAELITTGLQLLGGYFQAGHPAAILVGSLSGITLGGVFMVIGFIRDNRLDQERKRTDQERKRADTAEARVQQERERADTAEARIQQERERAAQERERADQLLTELLETRKIQDAMEARLRHLEERVNGNAPGTDAT